MQSSKYKYSTFNEMVNPGDYNFYGIIYDASFPLLEEKQNDNISSSNPTRYECTIKLIDKDVNCLTNEKDLNDHLINLIIKSTSKEAMPYIHSIGDIIRVHRGNYSHKKKRNVYLHLNNLKNTKSSWCIFAGASDVDSKDHSPILCSHENYTFEPQDDTIISSLRKFLKENLVRPGSLFYPLESKLDKRAMGSDYDVLVLVVYKTELDDQIVYYVQDETDGCELHTFKYFKFIDVNDVLRLRGYRVLDKNVIIMNQYSNILKIPQFTDYYRQFLLRIEKRIQGDVATPQNNNSEPGNNIINNNTTLNPETKLIDIPKTIVCQPQEVPDGMVIKHFDEYKANEKLLYLELNILDISPKPIYNFVNVLCTKCHSTYFSPDIEFEKNNTMFYCTNCKSEVLGQIHYNIVLHCIEHLYTNKIITLHLCSYDNEGGDFFGIVPVDFYRDSNAFMNLSARVKKYTDKNAYVKVIIEQIEVNDKDTVYRIVGNYKTNI